MHFVIFKTMLLVCYRPHHGNEKFYRPANYKLPTTIETLSHYFIGSGDFT